MSARCLIGYTEKEQQQQQNRTGSRFQGFIELLAPKAATTCSCHPQGSLSHWPIQLRLVPPKAPFLKGNPLLIAADCVGFSYPAFHQELLPGKSLLIGCPKFDDPEGYLAKLSEIFAENPIPELTVAIMEVPCCRGLPMLVKRAHEVIKKSRPFKVLVVSPQGKILKEEHWQ